MKKITLILFIVLNACSNSNESNEIIEVTIPGLNEIYVTGDITNQEFNEKIELEYGTDTRVITIENTTQLTEVVIQKNLSLLNDLIVKNNSSLNKISISFLEEIDRNFIVHDNALLNQFIFPKLDRVNEMKLFIEGGSNIFFDTLTTLNKLFILGENNIANFSFQNLVEANSITTNQVNVNFQKLELVKENISLNYSSDNSFNIPNLKEIKGDFNISNNTDTPINNDINISVPSVETIDGELRFFGSNNLDRDKIKTIKLENLKSIGSISIRDNLALNNLLLPSLVECSTKIKINSNDNLEIIDFSALKNAHDIIIGGGPRLTQCDLSSLSGNLNELLININSSSTSSNPNLTLGDIQNAVTIFIGTSSTSFSFPTLKSCFSMTTSGIETLNMPVLESIQRFYSYASILKTVNMPLVNDIDIFDVRNCRFSNQSVNDILAKFVNVPTAAASSEKLFVLYEQTPLAPPTGQGIINANIIRSKGHQVFTD